MPVRLNTLSSRWDIAIPEQTKVEEYYSSDHGFHGDGFAAEVIQTDTIPDDRYKRRKPMKRSYGLKLSRFFLPTDYSKLIGRVLKMTKKRKIPCNMQ